MINKDKLIVLKNISRTISRFGIEDMKAELEEYELPVALINYILNFPSFFLIVMNDVSSTNLNIQQNIIDLKKKICDVHLKKILDLILELCILDIQDVERNYIKYEFEREKLKFEEKYPNKEYIYPNQKEAAEQIAQDFFENNKKAISLIALPQIGKTGTFLYVAYLMATYKSEKVLKSENIFIITGMSDKDWEIQTKNDMLPQFKNNVFHHGKLNNSFKNIFMSKKGKKLLIIDESHHGNRKTQKMDKVICEIFGIKSVKEIIDLDNLILSVSATPGVTLMDLRRCGDFHSEIYIKPPTTYVGFEKFIEQNRMETSETLTEELLKNIKKKIKERYKTNYKYHIFRLTEKYNKILKKFCEDNGYIFKLHNASDKINSFDSLIEKIPSDHYFIVIKGFYRAGKRLNDKNIGIVYEHNSNINMESTPQGLIGRFCGNDKINTKDNSPYFYCNMKAIEQYIKQFQNKFDFKNYESTNLRIKNKVVKRENNSSMGRLKNKEYKEKGFITLEKYEEEIKDVPKVFKLTKEQYKKLSDENNDKVLIIKDIVKKDKYVFDKINNYTKAKITKPDTYNSIKSYKSHIMDSYNAYKKNQPYIHNIPLDKYKYENVWAAFVDNEKLHKNHVDELGEDLILIILIYHGKKRVELDNISDEEDTTSESDEEDNKKRKIIIPSIPKKKIQDK
jgi:hypothetical protein